LGEKGKTTGKGCGAQKEKKKKRSGKEKMCRDADRGNRRPKKKKNGRAFQRGREGGKLANGRQKNELLLLGRGGGGGEKKTGGFRENGRGETGSHRQKIFWGAAGPWGRALRSVPPFKITNTREKTYSFPSKWNLERT